MADAIRYGCITRRNCMENTSNYGLKRWDGEDRILHTEFNDNWDKIDTALKASEDKAAAALAAVASCGNCKIATGTYTGTGEYGVGNENSLTFPFEPKLVIVQNKDMSVADLGASDTHKYGMLLAIRGLSVYGLKTGLYPIRFTWQGNTLRWYGEVNPAYQLNIAGTTYCYLAIG